MSVLHAAAWGARGMTRAAEKKDTGARRCGRPPQGEAGRVPWTAAEFDVAVEDLDEAAAAAASARWWREVEEIARDAHGARWVPPADPAE